MLLTGEAPRRFSQRPITELPEHLADAPWASFVLRVLRRGTETNPAKRYQNVREFWNELSDALMPKTQLLSQPNGDEPISLAQVKGMSQRLAPLPPEPSPVQFERPQGQTQQSGGAKLRPRIVVPVAMAQAQTANTPEQVSSPIARETKIQPLPKTDAPLKPVERGSLMPRKTWFTEHARPWIVALLLLAGFALLLLGIQYQVRSRQRNAPTPAGTSTGAPAATSGNLQVGREMTTTTNLNLRAGPNRTYNRIGEVESGSRVSILQVNGNWCEVEILQRGFPRLAEASADRGWIDGTRLR